MSTHPSDQLTESLWQSTWNLPLPYDIVHLIASNYLPVSSDDIKNFSISCRSLAELCRPLKFRSVTINIDPGMDVTSLERFISLLEASSLEKQDIRQYIHELHIHWKNGFDMTKLQGTTKEQLTLSNILSTGFIMLNRIELAMDLSWTFILAQLLNALENILSLPTLRDVIFSSGTDIPRTFFVQLNRNLRTLEIHGDIEFSPMMKLGEAMATTSFSDSYCAPTRLLIKDASRTSNNLLSFLKGRRWPVRLSDLTVLEVYLKGPHIRQLNIILDLCSCTLTTLAVYVATWGGLPAALQLDSLPSLKSLTLTTDVSMIPIGLNRGTEAPLRFNWLVSALNSCLTLKSRLESIRIMLRIGTFESIINIPWRNMDSLLLYRPSSSSRWRNLRNFQIMFVNENQEEVNNFRACMAKELILKVLPNFSAAVAVNVEVTAERMQFWRI